MAVPKGFDKSDNAFFRTFFFFFAVCHHQPVHPGGSDECGRWKTGGSVFVLRVLPVIV